MSIPECFRALIVEEQPDGSFIRKIGEKCISDLPSGEVLIRVHFSSLNYKDALSATGNKGVTRKYPHTPGIDAAGEVAESTDPRFQPGMQVLVTGYDLGQNTSGGFGQYIRVPAEWVISLSGHLTPFTAMVYGTAGFTAALALDKTIRHHIAPDLGPVVITGASGGVGSIAVALFARAGYEVIAVTGKNSAHSMLTMLGARTIWSREQFLDTTGKPLLPGRWIAAFDTVGGAYLSTAIRGTKLHGVVTSCGNVGGAEFSLSVYPFILRGVELIGIDSANQDRTTRLPLWEKIGDEWFIEELSNIVRITSLDNINEEIDRILKGEIAGRVVVSLLD